MVVGEDVVVELEDGLVVLVVDDEGTVVEVVDVVEDVDVDSVGSDVVVIDGSPPASGAAEKNGSELWGWSVTSPRTAPTAADAITTARAVAPSHAAKSAKRRVMESLSDDRGIGGLTHG